MAVLTALRRTPGALRRNPALFVPVLVVLLFQIPQLVLRAIDPLVASVVSFGLSLVFVFVLPFFQGGIVGMADEALDGSTSLERFLDDGKANYVSLLGAYLALVAVNFAVGIVALFAALFGGLALFADGGDGPSLAVIAIVGVIVALLVLAYLVVVFFVQFYGQAIVVDDLGAIDGFRRSYTVVRRHLVSTLGYSVLVGVLGGVGGGAFAVASTLASPGTSAVVSLPQLSVAGTVGVALLVVVLGSLFGGFFSVYSVAFYRTISSRSMVGSR